MDTRIKTILFDDTNSLSFGLFISFFILKVFKRVGLATCDKCMHNKVNIFVGKKVSKYTFKNSLIFEQNTKTGCLFSSNICCLEEINFQTFFAN